MAYHLISADTRATLNKGMAPGGMLDARLPTLDRPLPWSADEARRALVSLGEAGRAEYRDYLVGYDMGFSLVIMPLFFITALRVSWPPRVALVGIFPALMDALENLSILRILSAFPEIPSRVGSWGPAFTLLKWVGVLLVVALCLVGALRLAITRLAAAR